MIKISKNILLSFVALVTGFIFAGNVFAFDKGQTASHYNEGTYTTIKEAFDYDSYQDSDYIFYKHTMSLGGETYNAYCLDGIRFSSGNGSEYVIESKLDDEDPKDAVLLAIINDDDASYNAKLLAMRAFLPFTNYLATNTAFANLDAGDVKEIYSNYNSGFVWAAKENDSIKTILGLSYNPSAKDLYKLSDLGEPAGYGSFDDDNTLNTRISDVAEARELFYRALKVGALVAKGNKMSDKEAIVSKPAYEDSSYELITSQDGSRRGSRLVKFDVTFKKFNDESTDPVTISVNPDTNGNVKLEYMEYQVLGTDTWTKFDSSTDFKSLLTKDSVTINVRARISAVVQKSEEYTVNFKVTLGYEDKVAIDASGALLIKNDGTKNSFQRFFIGEGDINTDTHVDKPYEFPLKWNDIKTYCSNNVPDKDDTDAFKEYMNTCCRGNNDEGFKIVDACETAKKANNQKDIDLWCNLKEEYCDYCNSTVTVPRTCSEFSLEEFKDEDGKEAKFTGPEDIKVCVMGGEDEAGQSYVLSKDSSVKPKTSENNGNSYCSVSCKEDYTMQLPTGRYAISGRYFTLKMDVEGKKTCYSDIIDYDKFNEDFNRYTTLIQGFVATGTANKNNAEFVNALNGYKKAVSDIKACNAGWKDDYEFDPEITFDYQEDYIDMLGDQKLKFVSEDKKVTNAGSWFCTGNDVNRKYDTCLGGSASTTAPTTTLNGYDCKLNSDGKTYSCNAKAEEIPTARYAKKSVIGQGTYAPDAVFYTKYSTGVVTTNPKSGELYKYTLLEEELDSKIPDSDKIITAGDVPVSLKDGKGVYNYGIKFNNIGEYFDKEGMGRLIGGKEAVALVNDDTTFKGTYVCSYVVNCTECDIVCDEIDEAPEGFESMSCEIDEPECTDCDIECVGECIYDPEYGQLFTVHQISTSNFNPNDRELGPNLTTEKGAALISELENSKDPISTEPEYSFVFTPAAIEFIKNEVNAKSDSYTEVPSTYENNASCKDVTSAAYAKCPYKKYSYFVGTKYGFTSKEYKEALKHDYTIYESSILDELGRKGFIKVKALKDTRKKVESWLDSSYCKNHTCGMVGAMGPAWK